MRDGVLTLQTVLLAIAAAVLLDRVAIGAIEPDAPQAMSDGGATFLLPLESADGVAWRWNEMLWGQGLEAGDDEKQTMPSDLAPPALRPGSGPN